MVKKLKTKKVQNSVKSVKKSNFLIGIVDDHMQTAISLSETLNGYGFKTFYTFEAGDIMYRAKQDKPNLLIVDIKLGGISGYEVARALPEQKILFMTDFEIYEDKISEFKNAIGVLSKPIVTEELLEIISKNFKI